MVSKSSIKKLSKSSLNSAPLGEFVVTLDEKNQELLSGGGNRLFVGGLTMNVSGEGMKTDSQNFTVTQKTNYSKWALGFLF